MYLNLITILFCLLSAPALISGAESSTDKGAAITDKMAASGVREIKKDTTLSKNRIKIDGIAAVIGDYVILESDIDKTMVDLKNQGVSLADISRCQLLGKLMEDKLYAHHAVQDSLEVTDAQVESITERQIQSFLQQVGSWEKILEFYKMESQESFRNELKGINRTRLLSENMRNKIIEEMEITPDEVRQFFDKIPEDERPVFGAELEIAQIVKEPVVPESEKQKVINRLREIKADVEEKGASFGMKAILYSQDPGSSSNRGYYKMTKQTNFVKEFKDVAFSLLEGEISEPFETAFGWHIIYIQKVRGQELDLQHILLIPEVPQKANDEAKEELKKLKDRILAGEISFDEAARKFSDEKETKFDGGQLRNPATFDTRFELTKMDPVLYNQVRELKDNEISLPVIDEDPRSLKTKYKILRVTNRFDEHVADFSKDYVRIKELALKEKQLRAIEKWMREKIKDTYINVNSENRNCNFANNWLKN